VQTTASDLGPVFLESQIAQSIRSLATYCEELFRLFEARGLQRIDASLFTDGVQSSGTVQVSGILAESYKVEVKSTNIPKIKAWLQKDPNAPDPEKISVDPEVNALWTVKINRYQDYYFSNP
jgi:hypothetical protein